MRFVALRCTPLPLRVLILQSRVGVALDVGGEQESKGTKRSAECDFPQVGGGRGRSSQVASDLVVISVSLENSN